MGSVSGQGPFDPKDLEYYAPRRLRERLGARRSQGARLESITRPVSPLPGFDGQPKSAGSVSLRNPLSPEVFREPAGPARETDPQASLFRPAARFAIATSVAVAAAVIGVAAVAALLFFLMAPAPRQSDTGSSSSEITGSTKVALPLPGKDDLASKPALAQFEGLLATPPAGRPAPQEQSKQLLQQFMQWRQKDNVTETSH